MSVNTLIDSPTEIDPADSGSGLSVAKDYVYDVDGVTYYSDRRKLTGAEIMAAAKIPLSEGLVQLFPDGTTATVAPDEEVDLEPDVKFKRRPRFKRG